MGPASKIGNCYILPGAECLANRTKLLKIFKKSRVFFGEFD